MDYQYLIFDIIIIYNQKYIWIYYNIHIYYHTYIIYYIYYNINIVSNSIIYIYKQI